MKHIFNQLFFILILMSTILPAAAPAATEPVTKCAAALAAAGTTYQLQNDLDCPGTAIWILNDNITLDLNDHTILYGSGNLDNSYGIALPASYARVEFENKSGSHNNITIKNGSITQNGSGSDGHGIVVRNGDHLEISALVIKVHGPDANGIRAEYAGGNMVIHDNRVDDAATTITSRHQGEAAINLLNVGEGKLRIYNNTITDSPQYGIRVAGKSATQYPLAQIYGNNISHWAHYANPYAISLDSKIQYADVYQNSVNTSQGRGIHIQCSNSKIHDNTIVAAQGAMPPEYPTYNWTHGIKIEGLGGISPKNNKIYGNTITVSAKPDGNAIGISISLEDGQSGNEIFGNMITANYDAAHADRYSTGVQLLGTGSSGLQIFDNIFQSQNRQVFIFYDGARDVTFKRNIWRKLPGATDYAMLYFWNGGGNNADDLFFYDSISWDGADQYEWATFQDIRWTSSSAVTNEFTVGWSVDISVAAPGAHLYSIQNMAADSILASGELLQQASVITNLPGYKKSKATGLTTYPNHFKISASTSGIAYQPVEITLTAPVQIIFDKTPQTNLLLPKLQRLPAPTITSIRLE